MKNETKLSLGFMILCVLVGLGSVAFAANVPKPEWTGKYCGAGYTHESRQEVADCVRDTLNDLYPDRAVDAKILSVTGGSEGSATDVWVFYRK